MTRSAPSQISQKIIELMGQRNINAKSLGTKTKISTQRLNEYLNGQRKPGVKILKKIARGLEVDISSLTNDSDENDPRLSKFEVIDIFVEALEQVQRKVFSASQLSVKEYRHLANLVECLGGWKKVMTVLEKEVFEAPLREKQFQKVRGEILNEIYSYTQSRSPLKKAK